MDDNKKDLDKAENIVWEERLSGKGNKYYVGHLEDEEDDSPMTEVVDGKHDFGIICDWYPEKSEIWKSTDPEFAETTAIVSYSVNEHSGIYSYIINFSNKEHYDYKFYDETGDSYECNTYRNGRHYVRYNSTKPKIVYITGS